MKIRVHSSCGYKGLNKVKFPIELEVRYICEDGLAYVPFTEMMSFPEWWWDEDDTADEADYTFFDDEYEIVEED